MNQKLRQCLEVKRAKAVHEAAERLAADANADVGEIVRRIETYAKLLTAVEPSPSRAWLWAIGVAVICLSVARLLWTFHVRHTRLTLNLQSEAVELKVMAPWSWSGDLALDTKLVQLEALSALEALLFPAAIESPWNDVWITVQGGNVSLKQLGLERHALLTIERTSDAPIDLYARGAKFWGQLLVSGAVHLAAGEKAAETNFAAHLDLIIPETIAFRVDGDAHVPTRVRLRPQEPWVLRDLRVQELRFSQETPAEPGAVAFVPAIMQGMLTLHDVLETITLREKERLSLTGVDGRVVELRAHDAINLIFEGTARTIDIGPKGFERNLTPTYLAYLYHQKPLAFFWGAVVFCWGVLWGIRKTIFA